MHLKGWAVVPQDVCGGDVEMTPALQSRDGTTNKLSQGMPLSKPRAKRAPHSAVASERVAAGLADFKRALGNN